MTLIAFRSTAKNLQESLLHPASVGSANSDLG